MFGLENGLRLAMARGATSAGSPADGAPEPDPERLLDGIALAPPSLVLVSGVTGRTMETDDALDGAYWRRQGREPAAFAECVKTLATLEVDVVVEIGPEAVLAPAVVPAWPSGADGNHEAPVVLSSLRRNAPSDNGFVEAVAGAYEAGLGVSFAGLFAGESRRRISLPGYPFERRRYWIEAPKWPPA